MFERKKIEVPKSNISAKSFTSKGEKEKSKKPVEKKAEVKKPTAKGKESFGDSAKKFFNNLFGTKQKKIEERKNDPKIRATIAKFEQKVEKKLKKNGKGY